MLLTTTMAMPLSSETDKLALLTLKDKLTNGDSNVLPSWNESLHFCEWQGVTCGRRHKRVSALHLQNQDLGGTLAPSLGNLTFLKKLNLTDLNLYGQIPRQVGRLKRLQILSFQQNHLHGEVPREVGRLKSLYALELTRNNLQGEIPMELINCSSLKKIDLSYNNLTGKVPSWFGSMMQLTMLELGFNNLVGNIPPTLGNLSSLDTLYLAGNNLEGPIIHALGRLSNLEYLSLSTNNLSGQVPNAFYNLSNLQVLDISNNKLMGPISSNLHLAFPNLSVFVVASNQFTDNFPSSLCNLTRLIEFDLSFNNFRGLIPPTWGSSNNLIYFGINYNGLIGSGKAQDLDFLSSLTNCTQLSYLILQGNNLGGVLPNLIGNFSTNLTVLDIAHNQISGSLPQEIGNLVGLGLLAMNKNSLEGTIPDSIGNLKNLVRLSLDDNNLSGNIPVAIGNLTMLSEVYMDSNNLEGSIPFTLRYCTNMQTFAAGNNNLSGSIPTQTFEYQQGLVNLDLASNSITGPIPPEFGNLKHLSKLYLFSNKLSGVIPIELGACSALIELYLDVNFFHGNIPSFLGSLRSLEFLGLSNNSFSGTIPHELENLTQLNALDLSNNQLYGKVPLGGIFSNITAISLIGNKDLCGGITQLNFPPCPKLPSNKHKSSLRKKIIVISVIGGILISFIIFVSIYCFMRKPKKLPFLPSLEHKYLRVSYGELHQATNGFSSSNLVGTGSFGSVYRGTLVHFERPVAVKVLNLQTRGASKSFMAECKALGKIKHRNLINILTCCSSVDYKGDDFKAIVFEFMPNGSLETLLHHTIEDSESTSPSLNLMQRVNIALDVAFALDYLHNDLEEAVVHCDIKPSNVLLDDDMVAHLGDFGLARLVHGVASHSSSDKGSSSVIKGTIGYVPPEYGAGRSISAKGDIYNYGILLLEIVTGKRPTDGIFGEDLSLHKFCKMAILEGISEIVDSRLLIPIDEQEERRVTQQQNIKECLESFARIGVACSEEFPSQRMNIKDVIMELHAIKHKLLP
ncbi:putative LRR receptor-like serine/threonine-protein kinase [Arachis hypogaea]|nr:putative LRR receptor-like serine/threonine-protein kinase [Arachis hypogaea]